LKDDDDDDDDDTAMLKLQVRLYTRELRIC